MKITTVAPPLRPYYITHPSEVIDGLILKTKNGDQYAILTKVDQELNLIEYYILNKYTGGQPIAIVGNSITELIEAINKRNVYIVKSMELLITEYYEEGWLDQGKPCN